MTAGWDEPADGDPEDGWAAWDATDEGVEGLGEAAGEAQLGPELREVGLIALQAAVLARRIYLPATRPGELSPEQWQVLLAVTLTESPEQGRPAASLGSIARLLTLTAEQARDCLAALIDAGHVTTAHDGPPEERTGERLRWTATPRGRAAARGYLERAGRFLPGWPPR